jgi:hypothetical protein
VDKSSRDIQGCLPKSSTCWGHFGGIEGQKFSLGGIAHTAPKYWRTNVMPEKLTDLSVRNAIAREKLYRLFDGKGLYLEVTPRGGCYWRLKYRLTGRDRRISLGVYPDVTLTRARERRDETRLLISQGIDPAAKRRQEKQLAMEETARQQAERRAAASQGNIKVTFHLDGPLEIWKGRQVLRITHEEALRVNDLLTHLLQRSDGNGRKAD